MYYNIKTKRSENNTIISDSTTIITEKTPFPPVDLLWVQKDNLIILQVRLTLPSIQKFDIPLRWFGELQKYQVRSLELFLINERK